MVAALVVAFAAVSTVIRVGAQQSPQASFRSRITFVPIDVRVLDDKWQPITDLTQSDFTVREDNVVQSIRYFSSQRLTADAPSSPATPALRGVTAAPGDLVPQTRRVFLIVLGRGRMKGPSRELPALTEFLETRLLPQDQVAILAFNRGTDFSTNHEAVTQVVARYRERHEKIETLLEEYFSGLRALYGSRTIPAFIQKEIDGVFAGVSALRPREITPGQGADSKQIATDARQTADELLRAELLAGRTGDFASLPDPAATATAERLDVSFDEFVARQVELNQDLGNLYAAIDYLRYLDGEKHLVFVTRQGVSLPRLEHNRTLAETASDARVALDILYVGGAPGAATPRYDVNGRLVMPVLPSTGSVFGQTFMVSDMRMMAEMTGGQLTAFRGAERGFTKLDDATRFQYLLGYYPSNATTNGAFRRVHVAVNRPGATVLYRQGYYASPQLVPLDRRQFITFRRLTAAGSYQGTISDIKVTLTPPSVQGSAGSQELLVEGRLQSDRIKFERVGDVYVASIDLGIYAGDGNRHVVGERLRKVELKLQETAYRAFLKDGAAFSGHIPLTGKPKYVKAIVYDYGADLLGSALATVK